MDNSVLSSSLIRAFFVRLQNTWICNAESAQQMPYMHMQGCLAEVLEMNTPN